MTEDLTGLPAPESDESGDLQAHEVAYGPNGTGEAPDPAPESAPSASTPSPAEEAESAAPPASDPATRDETGRFTKGQRHRAKSQQASAGDVPRIQELTAKLRAAEAERDALRSRPMPQAPPPPPQARQEPAQAPPLPQTRPKPSEDAIGDTYPTYAAYVEDLADWKIEQREALREAKQQHDQQQQTYRQWSTQYQQSAATVKARYPDFDAQLEAANQRTAAQGLTVPRVLLDAIVSSERGPEIEYYLATHHDDYTALIQDAWQVNAYSAIGMVRRVLESKLPVASAQRTPGAAAAGTGSAPSLNLVSPAPRPPNPVRTGPLKNGDDPPDEDDGLDAHERFFNKRR